MSKHHVALTGFMASGKSTIGKKLARRLGLPFWDLDDRIAQSHGPIEAIFAEEGEERFRQYELEALQVLIDDGPPGIIALGGGAVTYAPTRHLVKKRMYRVFLHVTPEQALGRVRRSKRLRPLLGPSPSLSRVKDLYARRMEFYAHADHVVQADRISTGRIVEDIVGWLKRKNIEL